MARRTLLLVSPPVLHAERWWANRIANKPHLDSLAGYVRDLADVRILELDIVAGEPDAEQVARLDEALTGPIDLVGISSCTTWAPAPWPAACGAWPPTFRSSWAVITPQPPRTTSRTISVIG